MNKKVKYMNINYPNGTHKNNSLKRVKTFANRGMNLEEDLTILVIIF